MVRILEKWSTKYKKSIDCNNPMGFSQRAHCAGRRKRKRGGKTKSRPVESTMENRMENLKEFFVKEVNQAVKKELVKKKLKESSKDLYEAVNLETKLKKEAADHKKLQLASTAVKLAEIKVLEDYDELDGGCDCGEGEGKMLKAQLLSIMNHAEKLFHMIDENDQLEDWIQSKITIAEDYMRASYSYLTYYNGGGEADESDWDEDEWDSEDWDDVDEDHVENQPEMFQQGLEMPVTQYQSALDPALDDDEIFEQKR